MKVDLQKAPLQDVTFKNLGDEDTFKNFQIERLLESSNQVLTSDVPMSGAIPNLLRKSTHTSNLKIKRFKVLIFKCNLNFYLCFFCNLIVLFV